jgi:hypothetical protein
VLDNLRLENLVLDDPMFESSKRSLLVNHLLIRSYK